VRRGSAYQGGFTFVELLAAVAIIAVLVAIAVPAYLGMSARAGNSAALANVRAAIPSAEAYYIDCDSYASSSGMGDCPGTGWHVFQSANAGSGDGSDLANAKGLAAYDTGVDVDQAIGGPSSYCLSKTIAGEIAKVVGPGGVVAKAATVCTTPTG